MVLFFSIIQKKYFLNKTKKLFFSEFKKLRKYLFKIFKIEGIKFIGFKLLCKKITIFLFKFFGILLSKLITNHRNFLFFLEFWLKYLSSKEPFFLKLLIFPQVIIIELKSFEIFLKKIFVHDNLNDPKKYWNLIFILSKISIFFFGVPLKLYNLE